MKELAAAARWQRHGRWTRSPLLLGRAMRQNAADVDFLAEFRAAYDRTLELQDGRIVRDQARGRTLARTQSTTS